MGFEDSYYKRMALEYLERRDFLLSGLESAGFRTYKPYGAYYIMTDISSFGFPDDTSFARALVKDIGVASVPGSSFYFNPRDGSGKIRFAFCKRMETLKRALELLCNVKSLRLGGSI